MTEVTSKLLLEGVMAVLSGAFPGVAVYSGEREEHPPETPAFTVKLMASSLEQELGRRYNRQFSFSIQYAPGSDQAEASLHETAEALFELFREVSIGGARYRGSKMRYEFTEKNLMFSFDFHMLVWRSAPEEPKMQSLKEEGRTKNGDQKNV